MDSGTTRFAPNTVVAGDRDFVDYAAILSNLRPLSGWSAYNSASITDAELDDRTGLNAVILGLDRASFEAAERGEIESIRMGSWLRDRSLLPGRVAARVAAFDRALADLSTALDRFAVRYVGLPRGDRPKYLAWGWNLIAKGSTWEVWERTTVRSR
jgi:hypothetical protein